MREEATGPKRSLEERLYDLFGGRLDGSEIGEAIVALREILRLKIPEEMADSEDGRVPTALSLDQAAVLLGEYAPEDVDEDVFFEGVIQGIQMIMLLAQEDSFVYRRLKEITGLS